MIQDTDEQIDQRDARMTNRRYLFCMLDELYNKSILNTTKSFGRGSIIKWQGEGLGMCYFKIGIHFINDELPKDEMIIGVRWSDLGQTATLVDKVNATIVDKLIKKHQGHFPTYYIRPIGIILQK